MNYINGGQSDEIVNGDAGNDRVFSGSGNDTANGGAGDDSVLGGQGNDIVNGGAGNDRVFGESGDDTVNGDAGNDSVFGGSGNDIVNGGAGDDQIFGGHGDDIVNGGSGNDQVFGGHGSDIVNGGSGSDSVLAGNGDDVAVYSMAENRGAQDYYNGQAGHDRLTLEFTAAEWEQADVRADVAAYLEVLQSPEGANPWVQGVNNFQFSAFDLTVSQFEALNVIVDGAAVIVDGVEVNQTNHNPTVSGPLEISMDEKDLFSNIDLLSGASDIDFDTLSVANVSGLEKGMLLLGNRIEVDLTDQNFDSLGEGETKEITITYDIEDGNGGSVARSAIVTVTGQNDIPVIGGETTGAVAAPGGTFGAKLLAPDGSNGDRFGISVAISVDGSTIVVGANGVDDLGTDSGAAYVFDQDGRFVTKLTAPDEAAEDYFGTSVAISEDGSTIVVGANGDDTLAGAAYVFDQDGTFVAKLTAPDASDGDYLGSRITISADGSTIVMGAPGDDGTEFSSGSAYVFSSNGTFLSKLTPTDEVRFSQFGSSVTISGDGSTIAVGTPYDNTGSVSIFSADGTFLSELTAPDGSPNDYFGFSVSLSEDGSVLVVGAHGDNNQYFSSGSAYVFASDGTLITKLTAPDEAAYDSFGFNVSVSSDGSTIAVGAPSTDDPVTSAGSAYIFEPDGSLIAKLTVPDGQQYGYFGIPVSVSEDGSMIVVGAYQYDGSSSRSGTAYVFTRDPDGNYVDFEGNVYGEGEGGPVTGQLTITDADAGQSSFQEIASGTPGDAGFGTFEVLADGRWTYILDENSAEVQALAGGEIVQDTLTVTSFDGSATETISVAITGSNQDPVAVGETFSMTEGESLSTDLLSNDGDIDTGDTLVITSANGTEAGTAFTVTSERGYQGQATVDASGTLVFEQGTGFDGLAAGQLDTVNIDYEISDGKGSTDTARASITIAGDGPAKVTQSVTANTPNSGQEISATLSTASTTVDGTVNAEIDINFGALLQPLINVVFVLDTSESTGNGVLDEEIAAVESLASEIVGLGYPNGTVSISIVPFSTTAGPDKAGNDTQTFVLDASDDAGTTDLEQLSSALGELVSDGKTNYIAALQEVDNVIDSLEAANGEATNLIYFLSDGRPYPTRVTNPETGTPVPQTIEQLEALVNDDTDGTSLNENAQISAFEIGHVDFLEYLDALDNTGGAEEVEDPSDLTAVLVGSPIPNGTVVDADVLIFDDSDTHGTLVETIALDVPGGPDTPENPNLLETPLGLELDLALAGLATDLGDANRVALMVNIDDNGDGIADLPLYLEVDVFGLA